MNITILPIEKGFCTTIELQSTYTMMIDCGSGGIFQPYKYIAEKRWQYLDYLILTAYNLDYLTGFPELINYCCEQNIPIQFLAFNPTITPSQLFHLQYFPILLGNCLQRCQGNSQTMKFDDLEIVFFWHQPANFFSPQNASLVTFISYRDIHMILPSDLHRDGWLNLLSLKHFQQNLEKVNIFVAADHGSDQGYCPEVFDYCSPAVVIISDQNNQTVNDHMMNQYASHVNHNKSDISQKKVLTTYEHGTIKISQQSESDCSPSIITQFESHRPMYLF